MNAEALNLVVDRIACDRLLVEKFDDYFAGSVPVEYLEFLSQADGGILANGSARFLSATERYPYGERIWEMNERDERVEILFIGHFCTQSREDNFGYKLDGMSKTSTTIYSVDPDTGDLIEEASSLEAFIRKLSL